jgi:hypothetical protein
MRSCIHTTTASSTSQLVEQLCACLTAVTAVLVPLQLTSISYIILSLAQLCIGTPTYTVVLLLLLLLVNTLPFSVAFHY